ncbi:hypothetical protein [Bdellovibrio sp. HCB337]|uniref:hypothetical protein n=1 Tax=Bdellovibrio sp. HCB337 TaxID=3394358 RepID=UPI0039A4E426
MAKKSSSQKNSQIQYFLEDLRFLSGLPVSKKYQRLTLDEYPLDGQLLTASSLYQQSRKLYLSLGGEFTPKVCSTMRSLSAQDLFKDEIEFTPSWSEILWFQDHSHELVDPEKELEALGRFNEISLYHEQNHRVIWRLLPKAPKEQSDFCRYLNFAESLVVTLDLALGDQLGRKTSPIFEDMKVIYRSGGQDTWHKKPKAVYRQYLLAIVCATYCILEWVNSEDVLKVVDYVFPGQKKMNKDATKRSLEISELFTRITNPQWQERYWKEAQAKLKKVNGKSEEDTLYMVEDPLDMEAEFYFAHRVFDYFGL